MQPLPLRLLSDSSGCTDHHFGPSAPFGFGNDGILDIRLVVSTDGRNLSYVAARNGRSPFIPLGINDCGHTTPTVVGGWCNPFRGGAGSVMQTSVDTSAEYMASGYVPSADGHELFFYSSVQPATHGGDATNLSWTNSSGIRISRLRTDGFVSVEAPYEFGPLEGLASLTTAALTVPSCAGAVQLRLNVETSVAGFAVVEVQQGGAAVRGMELAHSDPTKGSAVAAVATWGGGRLASLASLAGKRVQLRVAMADAKLFALRPACAA